MPISKKQLPIKNPRDELVAQGNDLIRHARFQLTTLEQNIIYFVMSKVKPTDKDFMRQSFTITEFCEVCGIQTGNRGGANYRVIKAAVKSVSDKSAWVEYPDGAEELVRWFDTYRIDHKSGTMTATLSQSIKPYLIGLIERAKAGGEGYTQAHLYTYLAMRSQYSKRLYEILKSYLYSSGGREKIYRLTFLEYELEELQILLNANNYTRYPDFRRKVLELAVEEINEVTDIIVSYSIVKTGRKITGINFSFQHKKDLDRMGAEVLAKKVLDSPKRSPKKN
ncbi:MAG: replication initiation protein [Oscillospiraceae bacterium]|nr:replication initiation protein [Oscillospiraceae bacterium]